MTNQQERILDYIKLHGSITCREAVYELGITQLPARIFELERDGVRIMKERIAGKNRFGEKCNYVRYKVVGE